MNKTGCVLTLVAWCIAPSAVAQTVAVPASNTGQPGSSGVNTPIRNQGQPRTYQARLRQADLTPPPVVTPPANAAAPGTGNLNTLVRNEPRTYQWRIPAAEVGVPAGTPFEGVAFRLGQTATNPPVWPVDEGATWANYEIRLARDANPGGANLAPTFAANELAPVPVRRGPLVIPPGAFTAGRAPNDWGFEIRFQRRYVYEGGNLIVTITHDGGSDTAAPALDVIARSGQAISAQSFRAATGSGTTYPIARFSRPGVAVGARFDALAYRLAPGGAAWPASPVTWNNYEVALAEDAAPGSPLSAAFALNQRFPVPARTGPLTLAAGAYPAGPSLPWGSDIRLPNPVFYTGGNLIVTLTHDGSSDPALPPFLDGVPAAGDTITAPSFRAASAGPEVNPLAVMRLTACPTGRAVTPASYANRAGEADAPDVFTSAGPGRTIQVQVSHSQLAGLRPGERIRAVRFRNDLSGLNPALWPSGVPARFENFEISLSAAANTLASFGSSVIANQKAPFTARRGPLVVPPGAFARNTEWALDVELQPYTYLGGDLVITISHDGSDAVSGFRVDAAPATDPVSRAGVAQGFRADTLTLNRPVPVLGLRVGPPAAPDVLWDNGPIANAAFAGAGSFDASLLLAPDSAMGFAAETNLNNALADRFAVAAPFGWRVDTIDLFPFQVNAGTGATTINQTVCVVWDGPPRAAGSSVVLTAGPTLADVFSGVYRAAAATPTNAARPIRRVRADLGGNVLPPGEYYVEMRFRGSAALAGPWVPPVAGPCGAPAGSALVSLAGGPFNPAQDNGKRIAFPFIVRGFVIACPGDYNGDAGVDFNDFLTFLNDFNLSRPRADLNGDGSWDFNDLLVFLNRFNEPC
jgi:hypothetical protein